MKLNIKVCKYCQSELSLIENDSNFKRLQCNNDKCKVVYKIPKKK